MGANITNSEKGELLRRRGKVREGRQGESASGLHGGRSEGDFLESASGLCRGRKGGGDEGRDLGAGEEGVEGSGSGGCGGGGAEAGTHLGIATELGITGRGRRGGMTGGGRVGGVIGGWLIGR